MKSVAKVIVNLIHFVSFCGVIIAGIFGVIYEFVGYAKFEQMFSAIGISKGFEHVFIISLVMVFLLIITYIIKTRVF